MEDYSEGKEQLNNINTGSSEKTEQPKKKSVKKNYIYNVIYQLFLLIVPLIVTPYVSRVLTPNGIGQYSFSHSLITYFTIFGALGFGYYAQREIAKNQGDSVKQSKTFWEINICRLFPVAIALATNIIFCITKLYGEYTILMWIFNVNILALAFDISFLFQGNEEFGKLVLRNVLIKCISIVCIFVFVKTSKDVWIYTIINSFMLIISNLSLWTYLPKTLCKVNERLCPFQHLKGTIILFIPTIAVSIYTVLDKTLIGLFVPGEYTVIEDGIEVVKKYSDLENGYYEQTEKIVKMAMTIITCIGTVMIPRNSKEIANGNYEQVKKNINLSSQLVLLIGLPISLGLIAISPNFVPWFFGDGYDKCITLFYILSPLIVIIGFSNVFGVQYLVPSGQDKKFTIALLCGAVSNLILSIIFIKFWWSIGAAIATIIAEIVVTFIMAIMVRKQLNFFKILLKGWKYFLASVIMFFVCFFISKNLKSSVLNTFIIACVGIISYFSILILLKDEMIYWVFNNVNSKFLLRHGKESKNTNRNVNLDLIKLISCLLIVLLHTIKYENSIFNLVLYNLGVFGIPMFLMVSGYLSLNKSNISYKYCLKKIINIIKLVFIFNMLIFIVEIYKSRDFLSSLSVFYEWFIQKGKLSVFWYFGLLIIIYLLLPLIKYIFEHKKINIIFMILLISINITINVLSLVNSNNINSYIIQTFRLHVYLLYFIVGGLICRYKSIIFAKLKKSINFLLLIIFTVIALLLCLYLEINVFNDLRCEFYYSYLVVILTSVLLFVFLLRINVKHVSCIVKASSLTLFVYCIHWILIILFNSILSKLGIEMTWYISIFRFFVILVSSFTISYIVNEIPIVNRIVKL